MEFQSTLPARGATINRSFLSVLQVDFNPRSPHGERLIGLINQSKNLMISIHAPRTGSDITTSRSSCGIEIFQSTLPARGATRRMDGLRLRDKHFNPRSPHGERLVALVLRRLRLAFQSTLPARGATRRQGVCHERDAISIHAPRTGSDVREVGELGRHQHFNPRSPHGERPTSSHSSLGIRPNFNPRSPHLSLIHI